MTDTPIHHYTFDNVDTTNHLIHDNISGGVNLTYSVGKTFPAGWDGNCLSGGDTNLNAHFSANTSFQSIFLRFKRYTTGAGDVEIIFSDSAQSHLIAIYNNLLYAYNAGSQYSNLTVSDTNWHSFALVQGTDNNHHWFWLDGVKSSTQINTGCAGLMMFLGRSSYASGQNQAIIDNVQWYDRVITDAEVAILSAAVSQNVTLPINNIGAISFSSPVVAPVSYGGGVVSFYPPGLSLIAVGGGSVAFDFPKTSPVSYGGGVSLFDSPELPLIASGGGISLFDFLSPEVDSWKSISKGYFKSPKILISASGGGAISFKGPRETVYSTGTFFNSGNISFNSHRIRVNAEGHVENVGRVSFFGPRIKVNVSGFSPTIGDISLSGPRMKVNADGLSSHGNISFSSLGIQVKGSGVVVHNYGILKYIKGQIR